MDKTMKLINIILGISKKKSKCHFVKKKYSIPENILKPWCRPLNVQ